MKVTISVAGRFWAFYLAQQLLKKDYLERIITSYPKFETVKYGIPRKKIVSLLAKEILERGWAKLPWFIRKLYNPQFFISELFDKAAAQRIPESDIFVGYSNFSLHSFHEAKKRGQITILERGSSHMLYQQKILREEYEKFGARIQLAHPDIVAKELREYEAADYIAIPSLYVKRTFLQYGVPEEKLIHVPYGVDISQFEQMKKKDDVFRVVFAGGMTLRKGVHYLLQAFSELNLPNAELLLIGSYNDEIKPFFKKYEGKFKWVGHIPQKDLHEYYSQGSVFVMMSIEEGLAQVQPQAMACGLPLICTENTGGDDIITDGVEGFVIPIRDVKALKEKLTYLHKNPSKAKEMGALAKQKVREGFTWDDYGRKIITAYEKALVAKHAPQPLPVLYCAVCGERRPAMFRELHKNSAFYECSVCGVEFMHPTETPQHEYYEAMYGETSEGYGKNKWEYKTFFEDSKTYDMKGSLLEVGCGPGYFLKQAQEKGFEAYGMDFNRYAIDYARREGLTHTEVADIEELKNTFPDKHFNIVSIMSVLEHCENPSQVLQDMHEKLLPKGFAVFVLPNAERTILSLNFRKKREGWDYPPHHLMRWKKETLLRFIQNKGFTIRIAREEGVRTLRECFQFTQGAFQLFTSTSLLARLKEHSRYTVGEVPRREAHDHYFLSLSASLLVSLLSFVKSVVVTIPTLVCVPFVFLAARIWRIRGTNLYVVAQKN